MHLIGRRNFVRGLGLGAAAGLFAPLGRRIVRDALGQPSTETNVLFVTQGNAWGPEIDTYLLSPGTTDTGKKSAMFEAAYRSPEDFDLPVWMADAFAPYRRELAIWFGLENFNNSNPDFPLHGCASGLLTAVKLKDIKAPNERGGGISIDRLMGRELQKRFGDPYDSTIAAVPPWGGLEHSGASPSYDGVGRPAVSYLTPLAAYNAYFGQAAGASPQQASALLDDERSLLDGMRQDVERMRQRLGGGVDREKLDQAVDALRTLEQKLQGFATNPRLSGSKPPPPTLDKTSSQFTEPMIRGLADVSLLAQFYGLTHVSMVSVHGEAAFSDSKGWTNIAGKGFDDMGEMHNGLFHSGRLAYPSLRLLHAAMAREVAWMRSQYETVKSAGGTLWDQSIIVWLTNAGLRHHWGNTAQLVLLLAGARTRIKTPNWADFFTYSPNDQPTTKRLRATQQMGRAYVSLANAAGIPMDAFGASQGSLPGVLK